MIEGLPKFLKKWILELSKKYTLVENWTNDKNLCWEHLLLEYSCTKVEGGHLIKAVKLKAYLTPMSRRLRWLILFKREGWFTSLLDTFFVESIIPNRIYFSPGTRDTDFGIALYLPSTSKNLRADDNESPFMDALADAIDRHAKMRTDARNEMQDTNVSADWQAARSDNVAKTIKFVRDINRATDLELVVDKNEADKDMPQGVPLHDKRGRRR